MSDVSVIGTGVMGSALVEALSSAGAEVVVWNRTREKAEHLSGPRVRLAASVAEALSSSPLTIMAVTNQKLSRALIEESGADLRGKAVAPLSFVTPEEARDYDAMVKTAGGRYLDVSIPSYPSEVRSGAGIFLISGDRAAYDAHGSWFQRIGRMTTYVDEAPGAAYVSEMAVLLAYLPMAVACFRDFASANTTGSPWSGSKKPFSSCIPFTSDRCSNGSAHKRISRRRTWRHRSTYGGKGRPITPLTCGN